MSSDDLSISVKGLSKRYEIYSQPVDRLKQMILPRVQRGLHRPARAYFQEFWALRDVNFGVKRGETIGIVGRNGSGKSTLLQIICGTLTQTLGTVSVNGRVAALLELGAGFNPEFTGKENVRLSGLLYGLSDEELRERYQSILDFAEIGDFIDQPVKTYSSGMYVRLAFAVAINVSPDILVIDEALSVGDEAFQRKCFARIDAIRDTGASVLFVSHAAQSVLQLCDRALLMEHGRDLLFSSPKKVVAYYQKLLYTPETRYQEVVEEIESVGAHESQADDDASVAHPKYSEQAIALNDLDDAERFDSELKSASAVEFESHGIQILAPRVLNEADKQVNVLAPGREYVYTYDVQFSCSADRVHFGMMIKSVSGVELYGTDSHAESEGIDHVPAGTLIRVAFRFRAQMLPGAYFMNAGCMGLTTKGDAFLHRIVDATVFKLEKTRSNRRYAGFFDIAEEQVCTWIQANGVPAAQRTAALVRSEADASAGAEHLLR